MTETANFPTARWDDLPKLTAAQMHQLLALATGKYGMDSRVLVEHTARNLVELVEAFAPDGPVLVVAGRGNNGSGGLAAARLLGARGRRVWVVPTHEYENYSGTPREQLELLRHFETVRIKSSLPKMKFGCVVDAAIGTHLEGPPRGRTLDVITVVNNLAGSCPVLSLDAPTGMRVDDGEVPGAVLAASMTLAVGLPKQGTRPGGTVGRLFVGDLALPPTLYADLGIDAQRFAGFVTEIC
ncbi:MAG: NAD(P)H-hydrate epimerase [Trueperaceae bacterium]